MRFDEEAGIRHAFGKGLDSEAWKRISSTDPDLRMPPPDSHQELKPEQIAILKQWIKQGAHWEGHWSFITPTLPAVPQVKNHDWVRNPIDAFVAAKLESMGLSPSGEADKERLLRRVHMDLIGLPPTVDEMDAFLNDTRGNAYEKVVDRLLESQHFGERMAINWMDAARYGDSSVFHADGPRDMWPWRDWVINAYNDNKPFDVFSVEQLAGDLLPNATLDQKIATGFNRNNASTDEGGVIAEEFRVEYAVDRVKTTSMVWMGLSVECAQCHNHKYDPITQQDYYRFFAYFNQAADPGMQTRKGNQAPVVSVMDNAQRREAEKLKEQLPELESKLAARGGEITADFEKWLAQASADAGDTPQLPADPLLHFPLDENKDATVTDVIDSKHTGTIKGNVAWADGKYGSAFQCDGKSFVDLGQVGDFDRTDAFSYGCWIKPAGNPSGAPLAKMHDGNGYRGFDIHTAGGRLQIHLIHSWPTNAIKVICKSSLKPNTWQHVFVTYDGSSKAAGVKVYLDGKPQEWTIEQDRLTATIRTTVPLYLGRRNPGSPYKGLIDDVRVYARQLSDTEVAALAGSDPIGPLLALPSGERTEQQQQTLRNYYLTTMDQTYRDLTQQIAAVKAKVTAATKPVSTVMVMQDVRSPRMTYILDRGHYGSPLKDQPVEPGILSALPALPEGAEPNRLGLAKWLVDPNHPLTARVTVNRYWYMLFGTGIVESLEDFGSQGSWPSHPNLLDWLAVDFVENGWNIKRTIKQMVMSSTYRQNARMTEELRQLDPQNLLLARGPRFRLAGELIRDNALAASGLLVPTIGGPSVKPYQPPGLWNEVSLSGARFVQDKGEKLYRRSLYTYWKRSAPAPSLTMFGTPTREKCTLRRALTNTPLQALVTMNDPQFLEVARVLAERVIKEGGETLDDRITLAYRLLAGVRPKPAILEILKQAFADEYPVFQQDHDRAAKLVSIGEAPRDQTLDVAEHAAMSVVTSMIMNLDETLTKG